MEPFDTVKIKEKGVLASMPAEETLSMQLFSQRPHLVAFAAKQEVEVSSAHWYGRTRTVRIMVREFVKQRQTEIVVEMRVLEMTQIKAFSTAVFTYPG